jgi:hypothetical protein
MTVFNIYRSWEAYTVAQKQSLRDWMDEENVQDFPCKKPAGWNCLICTDRETDIRKTIGISAYL